MPIKLRAEFELPREFWRARPFGCQGAFLPIDIHREIAVAAEESIFNLIHRDGEVVPLPRSDALRRRVG